MSYKELISGMKYLLRRPDASMFWNMDVVENKDVYKAEIKYKVSSSVFRSFARFGFVLGFFGVIFFGLILLASSAQRVEACEMVCGQVNPVAVFGNPSLDTGGNCKYSFGGGSTFKACVVNIGSSGGIVNVNSRCEDDTNVNACDVVQCPSNLHVGNGATCTIMSSVLFGGFCTGMPLTTDGKWDASEGKCVKCAGQMEDRVYNLSGNNFTDTDIANRCESACGGPASRDELATCTVASCVINTPTIVSITPASFTGPVGGSNVYTIKAINNNTNCGSYSIHFTAFLNGDLTADWVLGGSTGSVAEGNSGTTTITITAKATATPGTKNFTIYAFPHDDATNTDYPLKQTSSIASYIIPALPVEICNDPAIVDEDGSGLANCADIASCPIGVACEGGGKCQAGGICAAVASQPCSGSAMFTSPLGTSCAIRQILAVAIKWILALAGVVMILVIILGAMRYITSSGDEEKIRTSKRMLLYAIVGFAIILIAYELITDVAGIL